MVFSIPQPENISQLHVSGHYFIPVLLKKKKLELVELVHLLTYGPAFGADEFRLLCIPAAEKDKDKVVHVSLETYSQANCPEY